MALEHGDYGPLLVSESSALLVSVNADSEPAATDDGLVLKMGTPI